MPINQIRAPANAVDLGFVMGGQDWVAAAADVGDVMMLLMGDADEEDGVMMLVMLVISITQGNWWYLVYVNVKKLKKVVCGLVT